MEQIQEEVAAMKAQMEAQMTHLMEVITNMNRGQQELRALVESCRTEDDHRNPFDDASMGQPRVEHAAHNTDLGVNDHLLGQDLHLNGQFLHPPPTPSH